MADEFTLLETRLLDIPGQMRLHGPEKLKELAESMEREGQLQNIVVTPKEGGRYEVVAGCGRLLAARQLNWDKIRCLVRTGLSELDKAILTIEENDEREDISALERALSYKRAMDAGSLTQEQLAQKIGKTQAYVSQYIAVACLPEDVREIINRFIIGIAHLNQILRLPDNKGRITMIEKCAKDGLSVKQLENTITKMINAGTQSGKPANSAHLDGTHPSGFLIYRKGDELRVSGTFKADIQYPDLAKGLEESFKQWQNDQSAKPANAFKAKFEKAKEQAKELDTYFAGASDNLNELKNQLFKGDTSSVAKTTLDGFKKSLSTPQGRAMVEAMAKASGFNSADELIAKLEKDLKECEG
ncbi:MAG: ParB/RepB/Spo0J family partition protein [Elusimicrobia bacterium]|nr:ParB/RepB/Spo0J family partition protein [Candidatus Liberimonas magnetica]